MTRTQSDVEKKKEWGEGINRCRGELVNSALKDFLKCVFVSTCVWATHGGLKEHFKEPSEVVWPFPCAFGDSLNVRNELSF